MFEKLLNYLLRTKGERTFRTLAPDVRVGKGLIVQISQNAKFQLGKNMDFRNYINIWVGKEAKLTLGKNVFINNYCSINCLQSVEIGENTLFGEGVRVYDHNHEYSFAEGNLNVSRKDFTYGDVKIGKNCWLGSNVVVLKGVTIGDNSIIGAGCVIYKDVPENTILINNQQNLMKTIV